MDAHPSRMLGDLGDMELEHDNAEEDFPFATTLQQGVSCHSATCSHITVGYLG